MLPMKLRVLILKAPYLWLYIFRHKAVQISKTKGLSVAIYVSVAHTIAKM